MQDKVGRRVAALVYTLLLGGCAHAPWPARPGSAPPVERGHYRVAPGDTLARIARQHGRSLAELTRWNRLRNPDALEVGQILRVTPSADEARAARSPRPPAQTPGSPPRAAVPRERVAPATRISLIWPATGPVVRTFDGKRAKGIDIAGAPDTPVLAAAAGTVVYAGSGLRGYGNLLIIKHNCDFLTAYAHNRVLRVKEGQHVAQGQQIADMGDTDSPRVLLHFELRYRGRSVDPLAYLPSR